MRLTGFLPIIIIGSLFLFEVSARINEERDYKTPGKRPSTSRLASNNVLGPTYEVGPDNSSSEQKKNINRKRFEKHIKSWLNPIHGILVHADTPVYSVRSTGRRLRPDIQEYPNVFRHVLSNLYDDIVHASSLEINKNNIEKASNNNYQRPVPRRSKLPTRYIPKPFNSVRRSMINNDIRGNSLFGVGRQNSNSSSTSQQRNPGIPDMIFPEILVIVDYSLYKKFHRSVWELVIYLLGFWNGVDLRFRGLNRPRVRLNIAGILIAEDNRALDYIRANFHGSQTLFIPGALDAKRKWLYEQRAKLPLTSYDIAMTMTSLKLRGEDFDSEEYHTEAKGFATKGGACLIDYEFGKVLETGFVNDMGGQDAIMAAAHEIGHLLGANHDDKPNSKCDTKNGYVMSPILIYKATSWNWSTCSRSNFRNFLNAGNGTCLYNRPKEGVGIPRLLPGKLTSANEQCKAMGSGPAVIDDMMCLDLGCVEGNNPLVQKFFQAGAADGTACGTGKICIHGLCRAESSITY